MLHNKIVHEFDLDGVPFRLETGEIAANAQSAFMVYYGETCVLVTVTVGAYNPDLDFFPLTVDYTEKLYAGGYISSSPFIKREGRPGDNEILNGRLIDHAIRSLFPSYFRNETQVIAQVISYDTEHDPVLASIIGTSFALAYSGIPMLKLYGATRVGYFSGGFVPNPSLSQLKNCELEMMISSTDEGIISVEAEAHDIPEDILKKGIELALEHNDRLIAEQNEFLQKNGKKELKFEKIDKEAQEELCTEISGNFHDKLIEAIYIKDKMPREASIEEVKSAVLEYFNDRIEKEELERSTILVAFEKVMKGIVRKGIIEEGKRPDGRNLDEVRPIEISVGVLPRAHGSALFSRGETQSLTVVTLGTERDAQQLQDLTGEYSKRYFHHYNMPGYANGEVDRKLGFPNRRAIGHGSIGEKALKNMIASEEDFPYAIRVVSEITASNGSTSMAATCGSTLALMDAGVPVKKIVGGIGVGLVYEGKDNYRIVTDIIGFEDFYGDMDFKITGSKEGITAIQLDNKMAGIPKDVLFEAIDRSKVARIHVIQEMEKCLISSRKDTSKYAPKVKKVKIDSDKIGELIGPSGKNIKSIIEKTGVEISIDQDNSGNILIYAKSEEDFEKAVKLINLTIGDLEEGQIYDAEIVRLEPFGAFVEIDGTDTQGLVHVTNLGMGYIKDVRDVLKVGEMLKVRYAGKDERGRIKFAAEKKNNEMPTENEQAQ